MSDSRIKKSRYSEKTPTHVLREASARLKRDVEKKKADFRSAKEELDKSLLVQKNINNILELKNEQMQELESYQAIIEFFEEGIFNKEQHPKNVNKLIHTNGDFRIYFQNSGQSQYYLGCHHAIKELLEEVDLDQLEIFFTIKTSLIKGMNYGQKEVKCLLSSSPGISNGFFRNITDYPEE